MVSRLELHVWGPAFGLPSIDVESLAAIAYLKQSLQPEAYRLVQNSPSGVPTHSLPALHDPSTNAWCSGFNAITSYLRTHCTPSSQDPDASLSPRQRADAVAYATYLSTHAAPLVALSLYVSSANWVGATRPAYSKILPFPLTWTEPLAVRTSMDRRAEHLGMSSLDADAETEKATETEKAAAAAGWVQVPKSLRLPKKGVTDSMTPEQKARIRLDGLAAEVLDVLADWGLHEASPEERGKQSAVQCLEFAYLALMLVPDVPRPWLRENMRAKYPALCGFVEQFQTDHFTLSPWTEQDRIGPSALNLTTRFTAETLHGIPGLGEELKRWWLQPRDGKRDLLLGVGTGLLVLAAGTGAFFWRSLPPYGSPLYRWEKLKTGLGAFGAAGAMFMLPSVMGAEASLDVAE
ncbi:hypothetical protein GQ53DRAFT_699113 [Thozetella sp. PMI_491]|nr:hypothetical protein GQ53DRAFT_699113 [Thozetella sp. PMI_491]